MKIFFENFFKEIFKNK